MNYAFYITGLNKHMIVTLHDNQDKSVCKQNTYNYNLCRNDARDACQSMSGETTTDLATVADCDLHRQIHQHISLECEL